MEKWIGCTGKVTSIIIPSGDNLVQLFDLENKPKDYTDRFVYHPHQYLEKV